MIEWNHLTLMRFDCGDSRNPPRQRAQACVAFERGLIAESAINLDML